MKVLQCEFERNLTLISFKVKYYCTVCVNSAYLVDWRNRVLALQPSEGLGFFFSLCKVGIDSCQISRLWLPSAKNLPVLVTNQPFGLQIYLFKGKSFHVFKFRKIFNSFGLH